jgi:flagellar motor component MotA
MLRFIIGIILSIGTLVLVILIEGGNPAAFFNVTGLTIVIFLPFFASLSVYRFKELIKVWKDTFSGDKSKSAGNSMDILKFYEKFYYASGILCILLASVLILGHLGKIETLGSAIAVGISGLIYGILFGLFSRVQHSVIKKNN